MAHNASQQYLSTRGGSSGFSFENVVLKGLADVGNNLVKCFLETNAFLPTGWRLVHPGANTNST